MIHINRKFFKKKKKENKKKISTFLFEIHKTRKCLHPSNAFGKIMRMLHDFEKVICEYANFNYKHVTIPSCQYIKDRTSFG